MQREPMSEGDLADAKRILTQPLEGVSHEGWQLLKTRLSGVMQQIGDIGRAVEQELKIQQLLGKSVLPLTALPEGGYCRANTSLVYDLTNRLSLDERFDLLAVLMGNFGIDRSQLDLGVAPEGESGWTTMLTVNPVNLATKLGLSVVLSGLDNAKKVAAAATAYCQMVGPLVQNLPKARPTVSDWLQGRLESDYILLEPTAGQRWQNVAVQEPNRPLVVRQMRCNPATWFANESAIYSLSPDNVCHFTATDVQIGDLVNFACLAVTEPWVCQGIAAGTAPRIDISGCRVFDDDGWSDSPYCCQGDDGAWLNCHWADDANGDYGSLLLRE